MKQVVWRGVLILAAVGLSGLDAYASIEWHLRDKGVVILGDYHDNPTHHAHQQNAVNEIAPKAVIFEMLTPKEAKALADVPRDVDAMSKAVEGFHWSNIKDYAGVLARSSVIVGAAMPRDSVRAAFQQGAAALFGPDAAAYGLDDPLPEAEQNAREEQQFEAHCQAMPRDLMSGMVEAQRLRDAHFARTVLEAIDAYGEPVILITGNGHARTDWGVPVYLQRVRPDLLVESIGMGEEFLPPGGEYTWVIRDTPAPDRDDPCAAFK